MLDLAPPVKFTLSEEPKKVKKQKGKTFTERFAEKKKAESNRVFYEPPQALEEETWFRHSAWQVKRQRVYAALSSAGTSATSLTAFANCGADCYVAFDKETQRYKLEGCYCHNRHCEPCQRAKANLLAANLRERLGEKSTGRYRFITLTLKHSTEPLADQIKKLYSSFKTLRDRKFWKCSQLGGCMILEVKFNQGPHTWHPHLHIMAEGDFVRKQDLVDAWHEITGDSFIVDIKLIDSTKDAAHYVAKYVGKGTNNETWMNDDAAQEWICAMRGVRTCATFGTWRGFKLLEHGEDTGDWKRIGSLASIIREARQGQEYYMRLLQTLVDEKQYDPHKKRTKTSDPPNVVPI